MVRGFGNRGFRRVAGGPFVRFSQMNVVATAAGIYPIGEISKTFAPTIADNILLQIVEGMIGRLIEGRHDPIGFGGSSTERPTVVVVDDAPVSLHVTDCPMTLKADVVISCIGVGRIAGKIGFKQHSIPIGVMLFMAMPTISTGIVGLQAEPQNTIAVVAMG